VLIFLDFPIFQNY